jgi:hypothetical protein
MVYFRTKNPNLGKFWRALEWKTNILRTFGIFYDHLVTFHEHLVHFMTIWYIFFRFWYFMYQEKSGNHARRSSKFSRLSKGG